MFVIFCGQLGIRLSGKDKAGTDHPSPVRNPFFPKPQVAQVPPGAEVGEKLPAIHTLCDREATRTYRNGVIVFFGMSLIKPPTPTH